MSKLLETGLTPEERASADANDPQPLQHDKPQNPRLIENWLASLPNNRLLAEAQALAHELTTLKGIGHVPEKYTQHMWLNLGKGDVLCEVFYEPGDPGQISGPPEKCWPPEPEECNVTSILINGIWEDPEDFLSEAKMESMVYAALDQICEMRQDASEATAEDRAFYIDNDFCGDY